MDVPFSGEFLRGLPSFFTIMVTNGNLKFIPSLKLTVTFVHSSHKEGIWRKKQVTLVWHVKNIFNPSKLQSFKMCVTLKKLSFNQSKSFFEKKTVPQILFLKSSSSNQKVSPDSLQRSLSFVETESSKLGCPKHAMVPDLFGSAVSAFGGFPRRQTQTDRGPGSNHSPTFPLVNFHGWKMNPWKRCMSYWKWWYSSLLC